MYDDVIVLAPDGGVLARSEPSGLTVSPDAIAAQAVAQRGFVERFRVSDLGADARPVLLYAHRIDGLAGRCIGVQVLRLGFHDEMQRLFASVSTAGNPKAVVLPDDQNVALVSKDEAHVPVGTRLSDSADSEVALINFASRECLSASSRSRGCQGCQARAGRRGSCCPC